MSDKEITSKFTQETSSEKFGFGDYCSIPGCQSAFYDANRVKTGIAIFKLPKDPALRKKWLQVIKRYRRTGGTDKFSKTKKVMVCGFHFNPKQIRVSLGIGRKTYLPESVPSVFEFKPEEKKKERKPPKPRNNQETSSEFETESESSDFQCFGDASNSVVDFPEDIDNTSNTRVYAIRVYMMSHTRYSILKKNAFKNDTNMYEMRKT